LFALISIYCSIIGVAVARLSSEIREAVVKTSVNGLPMSYRVAERERRH